MLFQTKPCESNFLEDVQRLYSGSNVHFYIVGFANITRANNYLKRINKTLSGVIDCDVIAAMRGANGSKIYNNIAIALKVTTLPKLTMEQLPPRENETNIILVGYDKVDQFNEMCIYLKENLNYLQGSVVIYPHVCLKNSALINNKFRVIDRKAYFESWPLFMQIAHRQVPAREHNLFVQETYNGGAVISNGRSFFLADTKGKYFNVMNGQRKVCYGENVNDPQYNIMVFGDSKITGLLMSDEETIPSQLQLYFSNLNIQNKVSQYTYSSAEPLGSFMSIKNTVLPTNAIILCSASSYNNSLLKSKLVNLPIEMAALHYAKIIQEMHDYCTNLSIPFIFFTIGREIYIPNPTETEKFIWNAFSKYEYKIDMIMLTIKKYCFAHRIPFYDLSYLLTKPDRYNYLTDHGHLTPEGAHDIAYELGDILRYMLMKPENGTEKLIEQNIAEAKVEFQNLVAKRFETPQLISYLNNLKEISANKPSNSGVIVMNCNPFTLGHRYLIETARAQVEQLYILVVEEDKSAFKFKDRFEMIRLGVADIPNVEVMPSGEFVISTITFPEYFDKDAKQSEKIDPSFDVEIFCNKIAPALGCTKRFVGEEPLDLVTNQYNQKMAELLPKHGMELVVIPRKEQGDAPISASRVRKLMGEGRYDELKKLVPATTYDYLLSLKLP